jgi:hypothetical protein
VRVRHEPPQPIFWRAGIKIRRPAVDKASLSFDICLTLSNIYDGAQGRVALISSHAFEREALDRVDLMRVSVPMFGNRRRFDGVIQS